MKSWRVFFAFSFVISASAGLVTILHQKWFTPAADNNVQELSCPAVSDDLNVLVIFGQSNSANYSGITNSGFEDGALIHAANAAVLDWRNGRCFEARDPLPGADGPGGSLWSRLATISPNAQYVIVTLGAGGTTIGNWTGQTVPARSEHQNLPERLNLVSQRLAEQGYQADAVLFQQGESDRETSYADYRLSLNQLTQQVLSLFNAPFFIAKSTLCQHPELPQVRRAISEQIAENGRVFLGPDMDRIAAHTLDRTDQCHLSVIGAEKVADAWAATLEEI